ncbi:hypothetical protein FCIRC_3531 [Fusarium circinatum]|uniref:Uncharacterized protein n=1 Tax=Fusarium circinatum TaxID=48490 RepID=A0A8H5UD27_FUSCI|nr:hypothetical protein FCIRC_3531 [Fusarium circinatum]
MPPIRTEKSNSAAVAPAPGTDAPKKRLLKPVVKGVKDARFNSSVTDWDGKYHNLIGTSTRMIYFGYAFNGARDLTNEAVIRLAKGLPNLRTVSLPSADRVGDAGFLALISNCPDLRLLELTPGNRSSRDAVKITAKAFDGFCEHPEWAPGLKQIVISDDESNKEFMKSMRVLRKQREKLVVTLLDRSEQKKWGDWELTTMSKHYMKGRKCEPEKTPRGIAHRYGRIL